MLKVKRDPLARHRKLIDHLERHTWLYHVPTTDGACVINTELLAQCVEEWELKQ